MKFCKTCLLNKEDDQFYNSHKSKCKVCWKIRNREYKKNYNKTARAKELKKISLNKPENKAVKSIYDKKHWQDENYRNRERIRKRSPEYRAYVRAYLREKKITDINFRIKYVIRNRINRAIKDNYKSGSAVRDLGCSVEYFKEYIEQKFQPGMNWENWGRKGWHLDHIVPLSKFDLTNREECLKAFHYTNQQPLWWQDNLKKKDK